MLKSRIHGTWETHETLTTDAYGFITLEGFKGGYALSAEGMKASFTMEKDTDASLTLK